MAIKDPLMIPVFMVGMIIPKMTLPIEAPSVLAASAKV